MIAGSVYLGWERHRGTPTFCFGSHWSSKTRGGGVFGSSQDETQGPCHHHTQTLHGTAICRPIDPPLAPPLAISPVRTGSPRRVVPGIWFSQGVEIPTDLLLRAAEPSRASEDSGSCLSSQDGVGGDGEGWDRGRSGHHGFRWFGGCSNWMSDEQGKGTGSSIIRYIYILYIYVKWHPHVQLGSGARPELSERQEAAEFDMEVTPIWGGWTQSHPVGSNLIDHAWQIVANVWSVPDQSKIPHDIPGVADRMMFMLPNWANPWNWGMF